MKKLSLAVLAAMALAGCTQDFYADRGDATILTSKTLSADQVELTVQKDNGEIVTLKRQYDSHATVGARVNLHADKDNHQDSDLTTIKRYEFK